MSKKLYLDYGWLHVSIISGIMVQCQSNNVDKINVDARM